MFLLTAPFLFSQVNFDLSLSGADKCGNLIDSPFLVKTHSLTSLACNEYRIMPDEIASLTSFARKESEFSVHFLRGAERRSNLKLADSLKPDSIFTVQTVKKETAKTFRMKKSPLTAVLLSAALPGAGQYYNESYWKIPIIAGLVGYFGYEYFRQNNLYKDYRDDYTASQTTENPAGNLSLKTLREFYRNQRDDFVWYFLIVYTVNLIDAYVGAHLFDFDVREEKGGGKTDRSYHLKLNVNF